MNFHYLLQFVDEIGAYMIYLSTDYVFDGKNAPYKPGDQPNPLNKYGQSKLDGEVAVQKHGKYWIIATVGGAGRACPSH